MARVKLNPWPRQAQAIATKATELLFGGASEGGKSYYVRVCSIKWATEIPGLQIVIIRKYYADVIKNHMQGESNFKLMLKPWIDAKLVKVTENEIRFWNGSLITLIQCRTEEDFQKAQGLTKHVLIWEEATQIPARFINDIRGWVRMSVEMKASLPVEYRDCFPRIIYTCNPIGESVSYFRRAFITPRKPFEIEKVGAFTRQFIPSLITDNPSADARAQRERLGMMHSAQMAEALISGNWDAPTGDYYPEYDDELHAVDDFRPPAHWFKYRTFDWGSAEPFACLWFCVSDGERFVDDRGRDRYFPRGSIIVYREWYGCDPDDPSKGLHMRNQDIAEGIVSRSQELNMYPLTFTDSFPFSDRGSSKDQKKWTMADEFADHNVKLKLGNTRRVFGWQQIRSRLQGVAGVPMLYVCKRCVYTRQYIPALGYNPHDSEDAQENGEATHIMDCLRLGHSIRPFVQDEVKAKPVSWKPKNEVTMVSDLVEQISKVDQKVSYVSRR